MKQTYNKEAFRSLITLSIPTVLEEVLSTLLQYVDTAMVGHLGEKATAAVSTTTTIGWLIHSIPSAIAVAVLAIASKANGACGRSQTEETGWTINTICIYNRNVIGSDRACAVPVYSGVDGR